LDDKAFENKVNRDINKAKEDVATLGEDAVTGLSEYNAKVQEAADKFPGGFGEKATRYPWVAMSIALAFGIFLGNILKPAR
jgi:hypothetical protein